MSTAAGGSRLHAQAPSSEHSERKRKRRRRRRRSVKSGDGASTEAAGTRTREDEEKEAEKNREDEEVVSSAPSPLCKPSFPHDPDPPPELIEAFNRAEHDYEIKRGRHGHLVTMHCRPSQMFFNPELFPVAELATRAVLLAGRFVVGLSSSFDGQQLRKRCSGFWIDWKEESETGIVLTSTHLISSKGCSVEEWGEGVEEEYAPHGKVKYYPHAKVTVHFMDGSTTAGHLIYHQEHYDLAFFRVKMDRPVQLPSYNDEVKWGQLAFWLGRDADSNLTMTHLRPGYMNPNPYEPPHYMFFPGKEHIIKYDNGGPIVDLESKVVGIITSDRSGSFIPSSVLLKCLDLWNEFKCIPRPQLGLVFSGIKLLDFVQVEKIWLKYKINDGLIVNEVLKGSQAEEIGIRKGDIIKCFNEECISTTVQLENLLLSLCKSAGRGRDSKIHVSVRVFHVRQRRWKTREFTVGVSERLELIERVYKLVTLEEGTSATLASDLTKWLI